MKLAMFSVYDSAAEAYLQPFFMRTRGEAVRAFIDAVNGGQEAFTAHPGDYTLFYLGTFDQSLAAFEDCEPVSLGNAVSFVKKAPSLMEVEHA